MLIRRFSERITADIANRPLSAWRTFDWTIRDDVLSVNLSRFVAEADERSARLVAAQDIVVEDPSILGGTPVIRDTRVPIYDVAASVTAGIPRERILAAYPGLDDATLDLAILYVEANPVRGRPRRSPAPSAPATIMSERKVPRRPGA